MYTVSRRKDFDKEIIFGTYFFHECIIMYDFCKV